MIKLTWKFDGRTMPANRIADELTKAVRARAGAAKDAITRVPCPIHGTPPRNVRVSGGSVGASRLEYDFCCERLQQAVNGRFR